MKTRYQYPSAYRARKRNLKKAKHLRKTSAPQPILVCLRKDVISRDEFVAANFFLRLFRLRYGEHMIRACSFGNRDKEYRGIKSEEWYENSNILYQELVAELQKNRCLRVVLNICVYEKWPGFLLDCDIAKEKNFAEYQALKLGLALICKFLEKNYSI
ncbi:MAG: hypothetical protein RLN62_02990 [Rickettsiales bacterium]